jgi:hypothetical protein
VNRGKTVVKIEPFQISGVPHCGEGCGETLTGLKIEPSAGFETGKKFERTHRHAPFENKGTVRRVPTTDLGNNHGLFCCRGQTSCDTVMRGTPDEFLLHYDLLTFNFPLIHSHAEQTKTEKEKSSSRCAWKIGRIERWPGTGGKIICGTTGGNCSQGDSGSVEQGKAGLKLLVYEFEQKDV